MQDKNPKWRNEFMKRHRARRLYAIGDPEKHPLRVWRKTHELTMAATARILGTTATSIRNYELGINPTPEWVVESIAPENEAYLAKKIAEEKTVKICWTDHELRQWRKARGVSQEEAGFAVGRSKRTIEKWETGESPMPEWVMKRLEVYYANLNQKKDL